MSVLLTGATGFVGTEILARYLERTDEQLYVAVRARDEAEAGERVGETMRRFFGDRDAYRDRVFAVRADIERPGLGRSPSELESLAERVTDIVHAAASVSFSLPLGDSRR